MDRLQRVRIFIVNHLREEARHASDSQHRANSLDFNISGAMASSSYAYSYLRIVLLLDILEVAGLPTSSSERIATAQSLAGVAKVLGGQIKDVRERIDEIVEQLS